MEFHFENNSPVYLQMAAQLEMMIISGQFEPGQRLPSVRELALMSRTNPNTVSRALGELERRGLIETRRTSGKYVARQNSLLENTRQQAAIEACRTFLTRMSALGFTQEETAVLLERMMNDDSQN